MSQLSSFASGPIGMPPIASGLVGSGTITTGTTTYIYSAGYNAGTNATTSYVDVVNYPGAGVLTGVGLTGNSTVSGHTCDIIIDGVTVWTGGGSYQSVVTPVGDAVAHLDDNGPTLVANLLPTGNVPFKTSLQIRHKVSAGTGTVYLRYWKTT